MLPNLNRDAMSEPKRFVVAGVSDSRNARLSDEALAAMRCIRVWSGGKRHREIAGPMLPQGTEWIDVTVPLNDVFEKYRAHSEIALIASGDPLFYGIAATLQRAFPEAAIEVYPSPNSLQSLARQLAIPYGEMRCVSATGRPYTELDAALIEGEKLIGVLTDRRHTPDDIARRMLRYGFDNYSMAIGENLGNEQRQRCRRMSLADASRLGFEAPNCVILERTKQRSRPFGIAESDFEGLPGRPRMITKMPVRLLSLSMLGLHNRTSLWDIGYCTGSVSIEARLQFPRLKITSFEIRPECAGILERNAMRMGAPGIDAHTGDFLSLPLDELPRPDAVFIGGHGGKLREMLAKLSPYLLPGTAIVFNSVSEQSLELFEQAVAEQGMSITMRHRMALDDFNPITILKAE